MPCVVLARFHSNGMMKCLPLNNEQIAAAAAAAVYKHTRDPCSHVCRLQQSH